MRVHTCNECMCLYVYLWVYEYMCLCIHVHMSTCMIVYIWVPVHMYRGLYSLNLFIQLWGFTKHWNVNIFSFYFVSFSSPKKVWKVHFVKGADFDLNPHKFESGRQIMQTCWTGSDFTIIYSYLFIFVSLHLNFSF